MIGNALRAPNRGKEGRPRELGVNARGGGRESSRPEEREEAERVGNHGTEGCRRICYFGKDSRSQPGFVAEALPFRVTM